MSSALGNPAAYFLNLYSSHGAPNSSADEGSCDGRADVAPRNELAVTPTHELSDSTDEWVPLDVNNGQPGDDL